MVACAISGPTLDVTDMAGYRQDLLRFDRDLMIYYGLRMAVAGLLIAGVLTVTKRMRALGDPPPVADDGNEGYVEAWRQQARNDERASQGTASALP
jgi:hypothetical protein